MAKANPSGFLEDGIQTLTGGMNSGVLPQSIPTTQVSFATNATFRGGYIGNRPAFNRIKLLFGGDAALQQLSTKSNFQGACFYQTDYGQSQLVAAIGGRLFTFTPDSAGNATVADVTIPGSPNSALAVQAWLWQAERWVIWNDGAALPVFYDGTSSRRSLGPGGLLGTVVGTVTVPAVGSQVLVTLTSPYLGQYGINVELLDATTNATYIIEPYFATPQPNVLLTPVYLSSGVTVVGTGAQLFSMPSRQGIVSANTNPSTLASAVANGSMQTISNNYATFSGITNPPFNCLPTLIVDPNQPYKNAYGAGSNAVWNIGGQNFFPAAQQRGYTITGPYSFLGNSPLTVVLGSTLKWCACSASESCAYQACATTPVVKDPRTGVVSGGQPIPPAESFKPGDFITNTNPNPNVLVGTVTQSFNAVVGTQVGAILDTPYNGPAGATVWIQGSMFLAYPTATPDPINQVYLQNVNDTAGRVTSSGPTIQSISELPPGRMGVYGLGRVWMSLIDGRSFMAGDIVGGSSGSPQYQNRDSVLKSTENTYLAGGGNFAIPGSAGQITAMIFTANLDQSLGQGPLQVGTPTSMFSCQAPIDRTTWDVLTNPILTQSLIGLGPLGQNGTLLVNSDTIYRAVNGISSLILARRDFDKWGNVPISREVQKITDLDNQQLLTYATGIQFDNRLLMSCLPASSPLGTTHEGILALNFDPISSLRGKADSIYDGLWTGFNVMQLCAGRFLGIQRAFAFCFNTVSNSLELWEILPTGAANNFDNGTQPITWSFESAALFNSNKPAFDQIELVDAEIYISNLTGSAWIESWYRAENDPCWHEWTSFGVCASPGDPLQYRTRLGLGSPDITQCDQVNNRPCRIGTNFQVRIQITGSLSFMGAVFNAKPSPDTRLAKQVCGPLCSTVGQVDCEPCKSVGDCLQFPIVFYNLGSGKIYSNTKQTFTVNCPNTGNTVQYTVPEGTITYTLPFPVDFSGPFPPLILACPSGGNIVATIPDGSNQQQIDQIITSMINQCVQAYAQANAVCPSGTSAAVYYSLCAGSTAGSTVVLPSWITIDNANNRLVGAAGTYTGDNNTVATATAQAALDAYATAAISAGTLYCNSQTVYFVHTCGTGGALNYTGVLPGWITLDAANSRLVGAAGQEHASTVAAATALAQADLNTFGNAAVISGALSCTFQTFKIDGYFNGMFRNIFGGASAAPAWDGTFNYTANSKFYWVSNTARDNISCFDYSNNPKTLCRAILSVQGGVWTLSVVCDSNQLLWVGNNGSASSQLGVYNNTNGQNPPTVTIIGNNVAATDIGNIFSCS